MRPAIYSLLLCNVLFFAWATWIDASPPATQPPKDAQPLALAKANAAIESRCVTLGPFESAGSAQLVESSLSEKKVDSRVRQATRQVPDGYWIYVQGLVDAAARQQAIRKLARAGIRDAAELSNEQQRDRISLGLFTERDGAQQRLARARAAGFDPVLEERQRQISEFWVDADLERGTDVPDVQELGPLIQSVRSDISWRECAPAPAGG